MRWWVGDLRSRICEGGMANGDCGIQYISKTPRLGIERDKWMDRHGSGGNISLRV